MTLDEIWQANKPTEEEMAQWEAKREARLEKHPFDWDAFDAALAVPDDDEEEDECEEDDEL